MSNKSDKKGEGERVVFSHFAKTMDWPVDEDMIQSRPEPEPDILYDGPYGKIAFELVENCLEYLAHKFSQTIAGEEKKIFDPTEKIICDKLKKTYTTVHPIELLIYTNGRLAAPNDMAVKRLSDVIEVKRLNPFQRVWYFGKQNEIFMVWEK
jgi:hypothetical protein